MNLSSQEPTEKSTPDQRHDHDAWSGWSALIGVVAGVGIGLFFHRALVGGFILGSIGWIGGALIDRSRR